MRKDCFAFKKCCCTSPHGAFIALFFFINSAMNSRQIYPSQTSPNVQKFTVSASFIKMFKFP